MKKLFLKSLVSLLAIGGLLLPTSASAIVGTGAASLHLSPSSGSYTVGQSFTVTITETSASSIAAVEADLSYPAGLLQCNGPASLGAFAVSYQNSCSGGSLSLAVGVSGTPLTGTQVVGSFSFTALANGSASFKVGGSSDIDDATVTSVCDSTCASGATAANFTLAAPVSQPTQTTGQGSTGSTGSSATGSTSTSTGSKSGSTTKTASSSSTSTGQTTTTDNNDGTASVKGASTHHDSTKGASNHTSKPAWRNTAVVTSTGALVIVAAGLFLIQRRRKPVVAVATVPAKKSSPVKAIRKTKKA